MSFRRTGYGGIGKEFPVFMHRKVQIIKLFVSRKIPALKLGIKSNYCRRPVEKTTWVLYEGRMSVLLHQIVAANGKEAGDYRYFDLFFIDCNRPGCGTMFHLYEDGTTAWRRPGKRAKWCYPLPCFFPPCINWFYRLQVVEDQ